MDFLIPERTQIIVEMMDEFVKKELYPLEKDLDSDDYPAFEKELHKKREIVKQMELWAPNHPKEFGGMGLSLMEHALVSEVLGLGLKICQHSDYTASRQNSLNHSHYLSLDR